MMKRREVGWMNGMWGLWQTQFIDKKHEIYFKETYNLIIKEIFYFIS